MSSCASCQASCSLAPSSRIVRRTSQSATPAKPTSRIAVRTASGLQLAERVAHRAVRLPAEPADDAARAVEHRLDLAVVLDRLGLEAQILQARGALDVRELARVEPGEVDAGVADVLDRGVQRGAPLRRLPLVGLADQREADDGAEEGGAEHEQREGRDQPRRRQPAAPEPAVRVAAMLIPGPSGGPMSPSPDDPRAGMVNAERQQSRRAGLISGRTRASRCRERRRSRPRRSPW